MSIVIGCDSFLALRNVRNADLGRQLAGERVIVLTAPDQYAGSHEVAPEGVEIDCLFDFDASKDPVLAPLLERAYIARKAHYDPRTMFQKLQWSAYHAHPKGSLKLRVALLRARAKFHYYQAMGRLGYAQTWRRDFADALQKHPITARYVELLTRLDAKVVAAFSLEGPREMALMEAARKLGLKRLVMVRSRDNLAAKIQHMPDADIYTVWANTTRDFMLHLYPEIPPDRVIVTGTPQFDRHLNAELRMSRSEFFARVGLDPSRPLIVYTCVTPGLLKHEIDIAQHLADAVRDGKFVKNAQLLVRGHPRGFGSDFPLLKTVHPGTAVYPPPTNVTLRSPEHEAQVVRLILQDEPMHLATVAYQAVQVNVSGTMIVDSAILDKPTVCVHYDIPADTPEGLSTQRFYKRTDMQSILASGGMKLAHSPDECIALINRYLDNPALEADGRRVIREEEAGPLDGRAGERLAALLEKLAIAAS